MITRTDTVLIGKTCPASYTIVDSLTQGAVALFDENKNLIKNEAAAVTASTVVQAVGHFFPINTVSTRVIIVYIKIINCQTQRQSSLSFYFPYFRFPGQTNALIYLLFH